MKGVLVLFGLLGVSLATAQSFRTVPNEQLPKFKPGDVSEYWSAKVYHNSPGELLIFLRAQEPNLRRAAGRRLATLKEPRAIPILIEQLSAIDQSAKRPRLGSKADEDAGPESIARAGAATALAKFKDKSALPALERSVLRDPSFRVVEASLNALAAIGDPRSSSVLIDALSDANERVRYASARALRGFRDRRSVPPLIRMASEASPFVRIAAIEALAYVPDRRAVPVLIKAAETEKPWTAEFAVATLGKIGDRRAVPILEKLAKSKPIVDPNSARVVDLAGAAKAALSRIRR
jgi:HEAT repeat protein